MNQVAVIETDRTIVAMNRARLALAEAKTIQQTKLVMDTAAAAEIYAKRQKLGEEASELATSIKIEALRKLGEMLASSQRATGAKTIGGGGFSGGSTSAPPEDSPPTLAELGLTKKESAVAQKLAALPEAEFQQVLDGHVTVAKAIAAVNAEKKKTKQSSGGSTSAPPEDSAAIAPEPEPINDDGPTLAELVDELQAENTRLTAEITALAEADDQKAETLKWHRMYDHAMHRQADAERSAASHQRDAKRLANQVRECCKALGLEDPRQLVPTVKKLAARREAA